MWFIEDGKRYSEGGKTSTLGKSKAKFKRDQVVIFELSCP